MQLKEEFRTYEALRREHDAQIVHIAMEAGLRISPEQWSSLLYGDLVHKSHMQSIIDKVWDRSGSRASSARVCPDRLSLATAAVPRVLRQKCPGADHRSAEDRRPRQPHQPQTPPGAPGQHRPQPRCRSLGLA